MKLIATLITACLAVTLTKSNNYIVVYDDCSAQLIVEKDRNSKSADENGAQFILVLTNTSKDIKTFILSSKNLSEPCSNNTQYNRGTGSANVELDVSFQNNSLNRNNTNMTSNKDVILDGGESYKFIVNVKVPQGTRFNTWSCIDIDVKSKDCESTLDTKTLSVFVADPSEG